MNARETNPPYPPGPTSENRMYQAAFHLPASLLHRWAASGEPALLKQHQPAPRLWGGEEETKKR
eukprot:13821310-Alexandrium_andersonii.AAC.1